MTESSMVKEAAGGWLSSPCSGACQQRRRSPNQRMLMSPAEVRSSRKSTCQSPKTEAVEDLETRSPKFPPNLNQSPKCLSRTKAEAPARIEAQSACLSRKLRRLRREALVKVGIQDFDATVGVVATFDCKGQGHNSISKNLTRKSFLVAKLNNLVEFSHTIGMQLCISLRS